MGFARDFGGNNKYLVCRKSLLRRRARASRAFQRFGCGFGCHYALGFCFDDGGNNYYEGTIMGMGFGWDCSVGVLCNFGGNDHYEATGGLTQGCGAQGSLGMLYRLRRRRRLRRLRPGIRHAGHHLSPPARVRRQFQLPDRLRRRQHLRLRRRGVLVQRAGRRRRVPHQPARAGSGRHHGENAGRQDHSGPRAACHRGRRGSLHNALRTAGCVDGVSISGLLSRLGRRGVVRPPAGEAAAKEGRRGRSVTRRARAELAGLRDAVRKPLASLRQQQFNTQENTVSEIIQFCQAFGCDTEVIDSVSGPACQRDYLPVLEHSLRGAEPLTVVGGHVGCADRVRVSGNAVAVDGHVGPVAGAGDLSRAEAAT